MQIRQLAAAETGTYSLSLWDEQSPPKQLIDSVDARIERDL